MFEKGLETGWKPLPKFLCVCNAGIRFMLLFNARCCKYCKGSLLATQGYKDTESQGSIIQIKLVGLKLKYYVQMWIWVAQYSVAGCSVPSASASSMVTITVPALWVYSEASVLSHPPCSWNEGGWVAISFACNLAKRTWVWKLAEGWRGKASGLAWRSAVAYLSPPCFDTPACKENGRN